MASGYSSLHPVERKALANLDIPSSKVTQGWGYALASANYHAPEGWVRDDSFGYHRYSSCVDLSASLGFTSELKSRLVSAGFCPFFRDWPGNKHIHCVYVGLSTIQSGPKSQIIDYIKGLNGLVGHAPLTGELAPTAAERKTVSASFYAMDGHNTIIVKYSNKIVDCYAFMERMPNSSVEVTRCELRSFVEYFGGTVISDKLIRYNGNIIDYTPANPAVSGDFMRCNIRELSSLMGFKISSFTFDGISGTLTLSK